MNTKNAQIPIISIYQPHIIQKIPYWIIYEIQNKGKLKCYLKLYYKVPIHICTFMSAKDTYVV